MARAAVPGRLSSRPGPWRVATVREARPETATARTLVLDVPGWPGHVPGQHVAVKLTAEDGYSAQRDYSVASAPEPGRLELTVQRLEDGEVSPYLAGVAGPGDQFEVRGPVGGWFTWHHEDTAPLLLIAGGSGLVPLMSIIRTHERENSQVPVRLIYSVRSPAGTLYAAELSERVRASALRLTSLYTRAVARGEADTGPPAGWHARSGRIDASVIAEAAFPPDANPAIYVCGPSGFVESATTLLVAAGHAPRTIKTERFGPTS